MNSVSISLIIGTYNRGELISDTIESVLNQSVVPDEVLVVDDGSGNGTADFVERRFPTVKVLRKPNGGTSSARNFGAKNASHDYLVFLDHDDLLLPGAVEKLRELALEFPEAQAVFCDHQYHDVNSKKIILNHHKLIPAFSRLESIGVVRKTSNARLYGRPMYTALLRGNLLQQPWMVRRQVFLDLGGFDEAIRYCEDWDMYIRLTRQHEIALSDFVISIHRIEGENLHLESWLKQYEMYERTIHKQLLSKYPLSLSERWTLRKKLAQMEKRRGDHAVQEKDFRRGYKHYWNSFRWAPVDHIVCAKLLLWVPRLFSASN